jgi:hypothetical protein
VIMCIIWGQQDKPQTMKRLQIIRSIM